jgi:hypothetical protein
LTLRKSLTVRTSACSSTLSEATKYGYFTGDGGALFSRQTSPSRTLPSNGAPIVLIESAFAAPAMSKSPLTKRSIRLKTKAPCSFQGCPKACTF